MRIRLALVLLAAVVLQFCFAEQEESGEYRVKPKSRARQKVFVPSCEWQELAKDTSVPKGLEVQIDMSTGERFARAICDDDGNIVPYRKVAAYLAAKDEASRNGGRESTDLMAVPDSKSNTRRPPPSTDPNDPFANLNEEEKLEMLAWLERYTEMMSHLEDRVESMKRLVAVLAYEGSESSDLVEALELLEDLVHHVDTAMDLYLIGGMGPVLDMFEHPSPEVRKHAAWVIGTAAQNNNETQHVLADMGVVGSLLDLVKEDVDEVKIKALYALGSLVRGNARLQRLAAASGAIEELASVARTNADGKVKQKALGILADVLAEPDNPWILEDSVARLCEQYRFDIGEIVRETVAGSIVGEKTLTAALRLAQTLHPRVCPASGSSLDVLAGLGGDGGGESEGVGDSEWVSDRQQLARAVLLSIDTATHSGVEGGGAGAAM